MTKLPRLFVNGSFSRRVHPVSVSITENIIPLSTASMILPKGEELPARSWVELFTPYGSAGMYRVRSPKDAYGQETSTAELEHMIAEIGDSLVRDEIDEMMAATTAVSTVFSYYNGSLWQLGTYSAIGSGQVAVEAKYDSVLNVLLSILEQKPECMMTFNFSTTPWTVNIVSRGTSVVAEGRLARNVSSATVTYDDSDLTTRVWYQVFGNDETGTWTYTDTDTISTYGVIEGKVNTSRDMTSSEIEATVNAFIKAHKNPRVSVSIQATELYSITGNRIDKFLVGDLMRLALPDYNTTVELNITSISWNNVYDDPVMMVHLGDEDETIVTFLHNLDASGTGSGISSGRGGGRAAGKSDEAWKEYRSMWSVTDEMIEGIAQHVNKNNSILEQAGMQLNSQGVLIYADDNVNNVAAKLNVTASAIRSEVAAAESNIHTEIVQTASNFMVQVSQKSAVYEQWDDPSQAVNVQSGDIWIQSNGIRTYGKAGEYTWDTLGGYAWADFYGSTIKVLGEDGEWHEVGGDQLQNITRTVMEATDDRINLITDSMSGDYAEFIVELGRIHSRVTDVENGLSSTIEQTASMIRSAVWTANSEMYSEILQTQSMIRSEVASVTSNMQSTITQTASGIWTEVGRKATIYTQWSNPSNNNTIHTGDMWIKSNNIRSWLGMESKTWNALSEYTWSDFYGSKHYIWENGAWKQIASEQLENINHEVVEETDTRYRRVLEDMAGNYSEFLQEKDKIRSTVRDISNDLGSSILQTASMIRSDVWAAKSSLYSSITQTASEIRSEVGNSVSALRSSITQNANKISLVVESTAQGNAIKPASIVAAINDGASSVVISANHIDLDGYVKATDITSDLIKTKISNIGTLSVGYVSIGSGKSIIFNSTQGASTSTEELTYSKLIGLIKDLKISSSGNTYTLSKKNFNGGANDWVSVGTFSRAISSWTWGGGDGKINVQALPQSQTKSVKVSIDGSTSVTSNGTKTYTVMYENADGDDVSTGATLDVSISVSATAPEGKSLASNITGSVQVRSTVSGGSAGSYKSFGMYSDTYSPQGVSGSHDCIVVKDGQTIIGRYDIQTSLNSKYNLGWNDCRAQFLTSATQLWSVKTRTMTIDDVGRDFYIRDTSYTAYTYDPGTK